MINETSLMSPGWSSDFMRPAWPTFHLFLRDKLCFHEVFLHETGLVLGPMLGLKQGAIISKNLLSNRCISREVLVEIRDGCCRTSCTCSQQHGMQKKQTKPLTVLLGNSGKGSPESIYFCTPEAMKGQWKTSQSLKHMLSKGSSKNLTKLR